MKTGLPNYHYVVQNASQSLALVFFMPPTSFRQAALLEQTADSIGRQFGKEIRILKIDQTSYPEVFASFAITQLPTFILVRNGSEIWRQVGIPTEDLLTVLSKRLATTNI